MLSGHRHRTPSNCEGWHTGRNRAFNPLVMGLQSPKGSQAILIADNNVFARNLLTRELVDHGFFILAAANCEEAMRLSQSFEGEIQLLLSNADLPNGPVLADMMERQRPGIRLLEISKTTHDELIERSQERARWMKNRSCLPEDFLKEIRNALPSLATGDSRADS